MSQGNVAWELQYGEPFPAPSATPVKVINIANNTYGKVCLFGYGTSVPDGVTGWSPGAIFIDTDAAADAQVHYNEGTTASCSFIAQNT